MLLKQRNRLIDTLLNIKEEHELQRNKGEFCAKCFQFFSQFNSSQIVKKLFFTKVPYKKIYSRHQIQFDKLANAFSKNQYDIVDYIYFFVIESMFNEKQIDEKLANPQTVQEYIYYIQNKAKLKTIFKSINNTIEFISNECCSNGFKTCKDYLKYIIKQQRLGAYYITGNISKYFLAAIPNFDKVIPHLDHFSKLELADLQNLFNVYSVDANNAYMLYGNKKINPFGVTDESIKEKNIKNDDSIYDKNL